MHFHHCRFILSIAALLLLSSCASVFQGRNYSHLKYVKVKEHHTSLSKAKPELGENELFALQDVRTNAMAQLESSDLIILERKFADHFNDITSGMARSSTVHTEVLKSHTFTNVPLLSERKQKKLEAATDQLFGDMDHDLRLGILLIIGGIVVALFVFIPTIGWLFGVIATILVLIGLVYIIKYIVEKG
jgi:hypothetical protein